MAPKCGFAAMTMVICLMVRPGVCSAQQAITNEAAPEPSYKYDTAGTRLEGRLIHRKVYGPPGYGETPAQDERNTVLILKLLHPITVEPVAGVVAKTNPNAETFKHVHEVQLFVPRNAASDESKVVGRIVVATGILNEHVAPSNYTDVWMDVKTLIPK